METYVRESYYPRRSSGDRVVSCHCHSSHHVVVSSPCLHRLVYMLDSCHKNRDSVSLSRAWVTLFYDLSCTMYLKETYVFYLIKTKSAHLMEVVKNNPTHLMAVVKNKRSRFGGCGLKQMRALLLKVNMHIRCMLSINHLTSVTTMYIVSLPCTECVHRLPCVSMHLYTQYIVFRDFIL